jgi:hypothetical protein
MKKLILSIIALCWGVAGWATDFDGMYQSQGGELMFHFTGDSLYVDMAQSQRTVSAFKLVKSSHSNATTTYNAYETFVKNGNITYREVLIRVTRLEDQRYLLEYFGKDKDRDYNTAERYHLKKLE